MHVFVPFEIILFFFLRYRTLLLNPLIMTMINDHKEKLKSFRRRQNAKFSLFKKNSRYFKWRRIQIKTTQKNIKRKRNISSGGSVCKIFQAKKRKFQVLEVSARWLRPLHLLSIYWRGCGTLENVSLIWAHNSNWTTLKAQKMRKPVHFAYWPLSESVCE